MVQWDFFFLQELQQCVYLGGRTYSGVPKLPKTFSLRLISFNLDLAPQYYRSRHLLTLSSENPYLTPGICTLGLESLEFYLFGSMEP